MLLGRLRRPEVSPRCKHLGSGLPGLLGSCFWSFLPLVGFRLWLLPLPLLFFSSCACLVSLETAALRMLAVALAPETERTFAFGRSFCSVSGSAPSSLVASWCGSLGACLPFCPLPFPLKSLSLQG